MFPCNECCKLIIQSGIKKVIYSQKKTGVSWEQAASEKMFKLAGIEQEQFTPSEPVQLEFGERTAELESSGAAQGQSPVLGKFFHLVFFAATIWLLRR